MIYLNLCKLDLINLEKLLLIENTISDIKPLINAKFKNIKFINLGLNKIGDDNIPYLFKLKFQKLEEFGLYSNNFTDPSIFGFKNYENEANLPNLKVLFLGNNNINWKLKKDKINNYNLKDYYFHKDIILAMKNFNSPFPKNEKIHFYDSYENKINFLFDSVFYPHFVNTLMWKKINFDDKNVMNTELCNLNLFSKEISLALNMKRAILFNPINNINDQSINDDEKEKEIENIKNLRRKYDIIDFFAKKYERKDITFANNKDRKICFSRDFNQGKFLNSF